MIRLCVGLERVSDIKADLQQAFDAVAYQPTVQAAPGRPRSVVANG